MGKKKAAKRTAKKKPAAKRAKGATKKKPAAKRTAKKKATSKRKPPPQPAPPAPVELTRWATTQEQVALMFRVSRRTIAEWISAGMPAEIGRYDLLAIALWRLEKLRAKDDPELQKAQRRKAIAQADDAEQSALSRRLANEVEQKHLYHSEEVDLAAAELVLRIKSQIESWPDAIRQQFGPDVALELDESVRQLLNSLAGWAPK